MRLKELFCSKSSSTTNSTFPFDTDQLPLCLAPEHCRHPDAPDWSACHRRNAWRMYHHGRKVHPDLITKAVHHINCSGECFGKKQNSRILFLIFSNAQWVVNLVFLRPN